MAEIRRNKFSYDRNYYENLNSAPTEGTSAVQIEEEVRIEDFYDDPEIFTEEYTEHDFESTSPRRGYAERVETYPNAEVRVREKTKRKYNFSFLSILMLVVSLVAIVGASYRYIAARAELIQANKRIASAENDLKDIKNKNNALMKKLEVETDRNYIYTVAVSKLHMIYPKENNTIYYETPTEGYVRQYQEIPVANTGR